MPIFNEDDNKNDCIFREVKMIFVLVHRIYLKGSCRGRMRD
jgi:hypothetical protein